METEELCSFRTSKLLMEKGFDDYCWYWYEDDSDPIPSNDDYGPQCNSDHVSNDFICSCPTQQGAMRWLRKNRGLFIEIRRDNQYHLGQPVTPMTREDKERGHKPLYYACIFDDTSNMWTTEKREEYEDAVDDAILYCLYKLI